MARRHLSPIEWGGAFKTLLAERGVKRDKRGPKLVKANSASVAEIAEDCGVPERTARYRMAQHDAYEKLPKGAHIFTGTPHRERPGGPFQPAM